MKENKIDEMLYLSVLLGSNPANVQGGGGNISVKLDQQQMIIKSSGFTLKSITKDSGYSIVRYPEISRYLDSEHQDENGFSAIINAAIITTDTRPSIETGFHALLGTYVIHTHSIYANLLTCARMGPQLVEKLFPSALWVDYAMPGHALSAAIKMKLTKHSKYSCIIFLKNHGLIISADSCSAVLNSYQQVQTTIQNYFDLKVEDFDLNQCCFDREFMSNHVLFPDQVVYTASDTALLKTIAGKETLAAYSFILKTLEHKGLMPDFLENKQAKLLANLESERHRQCMILKQEKDFL